LVEFEPAFWAALIGGLATASGVILTLYFNRSGEIGDLSIRLRCHRNRDDKKLIVVRTSVQNTHRRTLQIDLAYLLVTETRRVTSATDKENEIRIAIKGIINSIPIGKKSKVIPLGRREVKLEYLKEKLVENLDMQVSSVDPHVLVGEGYSLIFLPYYYHSNTYLSGFEYQAFTAIHAAQSAGIHSVSFCVIARRKWPNKYLTSRFIDDQVLIPG
jgi:hypothetical protein